MKKMILVAMAVLLTACGGSGSGSSDVSSPSTSIKSHYQERIEAITADPPALGQTQMWGDSNTEGMLRTVKEYFTQNVPTDPETENAQKFETRVFNAGISAITTYGFSSAVDQLLSYKPKEVIIMLGTNDINFGFPTFPFYKNILEKVVASGAKVFVVSVMPRAITDLNDNLLVDALNKKIKATCEEMGVEFIDTNASIKERRRDFMLADGLHLNVQGYLYHASLIETLTDK